MTTKNPGYQHPDFLDRAALDAELTRVFEKCHDCRRCLPLCPSFPALFNAIDGHDLEAAKLTGEETRQVIDLCFECKLCYNHCPYHPPHEWELDFPKLMNRAKLVAAREEGIPLAEKVGQRQDLLGKGSCLASGITNRLYKNKAARALMEQITGIDRRWPMPEYESRPLSQQKRPSATTGANGRVAFFGTCFVEYNDAEAGRAAIQVLERNGVAVDYAYSGCCGAPFLHGGDLDAARRAAEHVVASLIDAVRAGTPVVVPGPTCSYQLKREIPELLGTEEARQVGAQTFDIGEFLWRLRAEKKLDTSFSRPLGTVAYHLPCHLKAQNIGFRSRQLLTIAGAKVEMLDHCSGVDGTWGMKKRYYDQSLAIAQPLLEGVRKLAADHVATDCPLAALRIQEGTGRRAVHPIVLLRDAYGMEKPA